MPYALRWECVYNSRNSGEAHGVSRGAQERWGGREEGLAHLGPNMGYREALKLSSAKDGGTQQVLSGEVI